MMKKFFVFAKNLKLETVKYIFKLKCFMPKSFIIVYKQNNIYFLIILWKTHIKRLVGTYLGQQITLKMKKLNKTQYFAYLISIAQNIFLNSFLHLKSLQWKKELSGFLSYILIIKILWWIWQLKKGSGHF